LNSNVFYIKFFFIQKVERNHSLNFVELFYTLLNGRNHGLSKENLRKFQLKCKFCQLVWMKYIYLFISLTFITTIAVIYLIVYISQDYNYYFMINLMFFLLASYITVEMASIMTFGVVIIYSTALYLRLNFKQITEQFQSISAKNLNSLQSLISDHNRICLMTKDCDILFSKIFGVLYFYMPFIVNLVLFISIYGNSSIYIRSLFSILAFFTSIGMYLLSYIPTQVSTEAHRCYNTINSINARYQMQLQTRLKVSFF